MEILTLRMTVCFGSGTGLGFRVFGVWSMCMFWSEMLPNFCLIGGPEIGLSLSNE